MLQRSDKHEGRGRPSIVGAVGWIARTVLVAAACSSAQAAECPAKNADERLRLIAAAGSCKAAVRINDACSEGTGVDTEPTEAAISLCEKSFKPKLRATQLKAYKASLAACEKKYENQTGTMYRSFTVYCQEHVAARYSPR